jgi:hypothetical protein
MSLNPKGTSEMPGYDTGITAAPGYNAPIAIMLIFLTVLSPFVVFVPLWVAWFGRLPFKFHGVSNVNWMTRLTMAGLVCLISLVFDLRTLVQFGLHDLWHNAMLLNQYATEPLSYLAVAFLVAMWLMAPTSIAAALYVRYLARFRDETDCIDPAAH